MEKLCFTTINLFQVTQKLRKNIRYRHIGRQRSRMPTTCAVVKCYNRHRKGSRISFYRFPKEPDLRRQWVAFVSRRNLDGSSWEPGEGDHICSQHFVTERKSETPSDPDYVLQFTHKVMVVLVLWHDFKEHSVGVLWPQNGKCCRKKKRNLNDCI